MKLRPLILVSTLVLTTLTTGCFGLFGSGGPEESAIVTVLNDLDPPNTMTIELRRDGDDEGTLGTVPGGAERALTYESRNLQGAYQLVARQPSGAAVVSREFTLFADARVRWQLRTNSVTVSQAR
ncbi:MAG TPA: hypothetical protein VK912_19160 [Longimicrobiales bacterium]|nr:hypothetical protein [Longimicrobiales bacterium]